MFKLVGRINSLIVKQLVILFTLFTFQTKQNKVVNSITQVILKVKSFEPYIDFPKH